MRHIPTIALCAAFAALTSCQQYQNVTLSFYKYLDPRDKSIALPRNSNSNPAKLERFRNELRRTGWRIVVAGVATGTDGSLYSNSGAKYTLIGEGETDQLARARAAFYFGLIGAMAANNAGHINLTMIESKTGEEVMNISGGESKWIPEATVQEMNKHVEPK